MGDSRRDDQRITADVAIIGSGLIGCAFARTLIEADPARKIVMIEAGEHHSRLVGECRKNNWAFQRDLSAYGHFVKGQMFPVSVVPAPGSPPSTKNALNPMQAANTNLPGAVVSYGVGGQAVHWTCAIPEQHPTLERSDLLSDDQWRELYARAAILLNRHSDVFSASVRHRVIRDFLNERGFPAIETPLAAQRIGQSEFVRFSGADTVLGPALADIAPDDPDANPLLHLLTGHCVTQLIVESGRVVRAQALDIKRGVVKSIEADTFVVAAGWLHTPQILWNSGIHAAEESALGRYLTDHTFTAATIVLNDEVFDRIRERARDTLTADQDDPCLWDIPKADPPPHMYIPVADDRPWHSMIFRESFHFDPLPDDWDDRRIVDLKWFGMVEPNRDNRVTFSSDGNVDRLGMPQPTFHVRLSDDDELRLNAMFDNMKRVAAMLGTPLPGPLYAPQHVPLGTSTHTMGLTRIGRDEEGDWESVCDTRSKVRGLENLYVGGNCVLPTANACNPTYTSMALALRAADAIIAA